VSICETSGHLVQLKDLFGLNPANIYDLKIVQIFFLRRFPRKCIGCSQDINSNELIMRALNSVFHIHCFKCLVCEKQLNTGEEYGIGKDNVSIFCRQHYNNFQIDYHQPL